MSRLLEAGLRVEPYGIVASGPPSAGGEPTYSYDAVRVPIRLAESCDPADRALAAKLWPRLRDHPGAASRKLDGTPTTSDESPAALVGAAAAAQAAGDRGAASSLLARAAALDASHPTYYGAAWATSAARCWSITRWVAVDERQLRAGEGGGDFDRLGGPWRIDHRIGRHSAIDLAARPI